MTSTIALPMAATSKRALKAVARWLVAEAPGTGVKVFVDTAPVMEKPLAAAAGLGWQGKHTNMVSRDHGSWLFLGAIYTPPDLTPGAPGADGRSAGRPGGHECAMRCRTWRAPDH